MTWQDVIQRQEGAWQVTLHGKGGKTRTVYCASKDAWRALQALRSDQRETGKGRPADFVWQGKHGPLTPVGVFRIVRASAAHAGIAASVSPHWLRHAHASHALDNGAPTHEVKDTLGHASLATTSRYSHARPGSSSSTYLRA